MPFTPDSLAPFLHGIAECEAAADGALRLSRVPLRLLPAANDRVRLRTWSPAGAELRFRQTGPVRLRLTRMNDGNPVFAGPGASLAGLFRGDFQTNWYALPPGDTEIVIPPFAGDLGVLRQHRWRYAPELTRVILPVFPEIRLASLAGDLHAPQPDDVPRTRYLAYGSSITQGAYAPLGTGTYPAVVARLLQADPLNVGFGGGAHLEPELADWLAARPDWDFASLEMGINVMGLEPEAFRQRVRRFLAPFAADPARRPVFCLDLLPSQGEIAGPAAAKAAAFRAVVAEEQAAAGAAHLHRLDYCGGLTRLSDLADDLVHPASHAFEDLGQHLAAQMRNLLPAKLLSDTCR